MSRPCRSARSCAGWSPTRACSPVLRRNGIPADTYSNKCCCGLGHSQGKPLRLGARFPPGPMALPHLPACCFQPTFGTLPKNSGFGARGGPTRNNLVSEIVDLYRRTSRSGLSSTGPKHTIDHIDKHNNWLANSSGTEKHERRPPWSTASTADHGARPGSCIYELGTKPATSIERHCTTTAPAAA